MRKIRIFTAIAALAFCGSALADPQWICGDSPCVTVAPYNSPYTSTGVATGLHDLVVDGSAFDVTFFTDTEISPFLYSTVPSVLGQPITGLDAGNALQTFVNTIDPDMTSNQLSGPFQRDESQSWIVTATSPGRDGDLNLDLAQMFIGGTIPLTTVATTFPGGGTVVQTTSTSQQNECSRFICTQWTPISQVVGAPEISLSTAPAALMLLLGLFAIAKERRTRS